MTDPRAILDVRNVTKRFPGVTALRAVSLRLHAGEVLALVGENGAGKSTLMKILAGVEQPDEGEILIDGQPVRLESCRAALNRGIALIHQELNLADNLDVGANILLGREPHRWSWMNRAHIAREARRQLERVGLDVSPDVLVSTLSLAQQQMVEIAKALSVDARILIMDEPTSSLTAGETEALFRVVRDLRTAGVSIVYISHRLAEVKALADRVEVLRDGRNAGHLAREEISHSSLVRLMVGRDLPARPDRDNPGKIESPAPPAALAAEAVITAAWPDHAVTFQLGRGEIVGLAGLVGAGRSELLRVLFGLDRAIGGRVLVNGQPVSLHGPMDAIQHGIALVPEDRKLEGLVLEMSIQDNLALAAGTRHTRAGIFLNPEAEARDASATIGRLRIKTPDAAQAVQLLSGGNQQKVVLGKWLLLNPRVLLLDEPTRGVDAGAKQEIYALVEALASDGVAVLFASSDLEEVLRLSHRTLVMHEGRIAGTLEGQGLTEQAVMELATGQGLNQRPYDA